MTKAVNVLVSLALGLSLAGAAAANPNQGVDAAKYFKGKNVMIYDQPLDDRGNSWFATPKKVMAFNQKTKKPDVISVLVEGRGYSVEFSDMIVVNCSKPTASYIDRGRNGKITLKDSMAIESTPWDANHNDHIPREAVSGLFKRYCK